MTVSFDDIWEYTQHVSSETAFSRAECEALYDTVQRLRPGSLVCEVGCEFGRSTSVLAQSCLGPNHWLVLIEPRPKPELMRMLDDLGVIYTLHVMPTVMIPEVALPDSIDLVHIDGDHSERAVAVDCMRLLPRVRLGGYACFHDYGRDSLPDVKWTVDRYTPPADWSLVGTHETLRILKREGRRVS